MFKRKNNGVAADGYPMLMERIIESIKHLSESGEEQLALQPDFVNRPYEMASSLDDWLLIYNSGLSCKNKPLFSDSEYKLILELNDKFRWFHCSDEYSESDWTEEAVRTSKK